jgi:hypothetical protein
MKAKQDNLIIIYINDEDGFNEIATPILFKIITSYKPDYCEFLNPNSFVVYYKAIAKKQKIADLLIAEIKELIIRDEGFKDTRIGAAYGKMIFQADWLGRIKSSPMGGPGNDAMKNIIFSRHTS